MPGWWHMPLVLALRKQRQRWRAACIGQVPDNKGSLVILSLNKLNKQASQRDGQEEGVEMLKS